MAEGFLKALDSNLEVLSAGTEPSNQTHPMAVEVMQELGVDISNNFPKGVDEFLQDKFDYVITVCGGARDTCPTFAGEVKQTLHIGFDDPAEATGSTEDIKEQFRMIRDQILRDFFSFYQKNIK